MRKINFYGISIEKNYPEAMKWFRLSAEKFDSDAQYYIGRMYYNGCGVDLNYEEALKWYTLSAEQNNSKGINGVASMYYDGFGGYKQDYVQSMNLYIKSSALNNPRALCCVGFFYHQGLGLDQNFDEAMKWYLLSAEKKVFTRLLSHWIYVPIWKWSKN